MLHLSEGGGPAGMSLCVSPVVPMRLQSLSLGVLLGAGVEEASVFSMGLI